MELDGSVIHLRTVRPDPASLLRRFLEAVSPEDIRARFHGALRDFSGPLLIRLTQIDYDREIALVGFRDGDVAARRCPTLGQNRTVSAANFLFSFAVACTATVWVRH